ncbi:MAG: hypothetical protein EXR51_11170 [Dehalococcoidia bacterium]|nr:hypothetical protein [Dehalococcoidia bacterium]
MTTINWRERLLPVAIALTLGMTGLLALAFPVGSSAQVTEPPRLVQPEDRATLPDFGPTLNWANPAGTTQYQLQVTPAQNDGPGINLIIEGNGQSFSVPPPPRWYGLMPAMNYSWRARASDSAAAIDEGDASWGPWSDPRTFRTPAVSASSVTLANPSNGVAVTSVTPTLSWTEANGSIF